MSFLSGLLGPGLAIAGNMIAPGIGGVLGGMAGGLLGGSGSQQSGNLTTNAQQKMDPRIESMLFGSDNNGLLSRYQGLLDAPQMNGLKQYGNATNDYLGGTGAADLQMMHDKAAGMLNPNAAPQMSANAANTSGADVLWNKGESVNAPGQNGVNLTNAYQGMVYGDPASNPYLTGAIGKGINQSNNAFANMQDAATSNLMKNILPSIRSNSVLAGQYGGSRQGIAEGNAIGDFAKAQQQAISQFGQNNTDAAVSAQAGAFDNGQNRALSAMQGLGAQQYGVAAQNSSQAQQANMANQNAGNAASMFNAGAANNTSQYNAGLAQQAGSANLQAQMNTNQLNSANAFNGLGALSGLQSGAYTGATNANNYDLNRATGVNGLLSPYLSANQSSTTSQPLYQNKAGNALGGAMLGSQIGGLFGSKDGGIGGGPLGGLSDLFSGKFMNF